MLKRSKRVIRTASIGNGPSRLSYRIVESVAAKKIRIRVSLSGIEVVKPRKKSLADVRKFVSANAKWVAIQERHLDKYRSIRRQGVESVNKILYKGLPTKVEISLKHGYKGRSFVECQDGKLTVFLSSKSTIAPHKTLENWLRKKAKNTLLSDIQPILKKVRRTPNKIYVMGQRTKWGNCSSMGNLSFNWRLILAPEFVRKYLVTHEAVHLAIPDHSHKFWLTVMSLCPDSEKARRWLSANSDQLMVDLKNIASGRNIGQKGAKESERKQCNT